MVTTTRHHVSTRGQGDAHDLTEAVSAAVAESGMAAGVVTVFVVASTAAVTTIEFEPGAVADLNRLFEQLAPRVATISIICGGETITGRVTSARRCLGRR